MQLKQIQNKKNNEKKDGVIRDIHHEKDYK